MPLKVTFANVQFCTLKHKNVFKLKFVDLLNLQIIFHFLKIELDFPLANGMLF